MNLRLLSAGRGLWQSAHGEFIYEARNGSILRLYWDYMLNRYEAFPAHNTRNVEPAA